MFSQHYSGYGRKGVGCWYCGEHNHVAKNCRHGNFISCNRYHEQGHKERFCNYQVDGQHDCAVSGNSSVFKVGVGKLKTKRRHRRGGVGKKQCKSLKSKIDFLNIRGIRSTIHVVNTHLEDNSPDILSLAETFLRSDDKPQLLHTGYNWFGKCRKSVKDKGGIGI